MDKIDFVSYLEQLLSQADILEICGFLGFKPNRRNMGICPKCNEDAFYINQDMNSFRCMACNDHGDVLSFQQRLLNLPFPTSVSILDGEQWKQWWSEEYLTEFGAVRDCMTAAAVFLANQLGGVEEYLSRRGISDDLARECLLGAGQGKKSLKNHLLQRKFDLEIIRRSGLLNQYDQDRFQDHVVIPLRQHGQVFDFYGRYVGNDSEIAKHWRLPSDRLVVGRGYFNWNPNQEKVICVEGIFDALSLIQNGFQNAVSTWGTNGLNPERLKGTNIKKVWMCFDPDSAGRERSLKVAYKLKDAGTDVLIVDLPEGLDPNEYFVKGNSRESFAILIQQAKTPEQREISNVPDDLDAPAKIDALQNVMSRVAKMSLVQQVAYSKMIAEKTKLKEKEVREHLAGLAQKMESENKTFLDMDKYERVHPALHHSPSAALLTVSLMTQDANGLTSLEPWVITSKRESFPLQHTELLKRGWYCQNIVNPGRMPYTQATIEGFLKRTLKGDFSGTFGRIRDLYKEFVDFPMPETFDYLAAWTIGTYFFPLFNYYPYLHFTGTKEVGKSKAMKIMSCLCFNGLLSVSITDASQFRVITELLPTLFLDESENLSDKTYSERRALLLGGYEKGGGVLRTEKSGDVFEVRQYENYGPRAFASIGDMENTLASRTVQILMQRSYDERIKNAEVQLTDTRFKTLRDELFLVTMDFSNQVRTAYEHAQKPADASFDGREWNLFKPVYAIGMVIGNPETTASLLRFANAAFEAKSIAFNRGSVENVVLRVLLVLVQKEDTYSIDDIHEALIAHIRDEGLDLGRITKNDLGKLLDKLGVVNNKVRRQSGGQRTTVYSLSPEKVRQVSVNRNVVEAGAMDTDKSEQVDI